MPLWSNGRPSLTQRSAVLDLVQDKPAQSACVASAILDQACARRSLWETGRDEGMADPAEPRDHSQYSPWRRGATDSGAISSSGNILS